MPPSNFDIHLCTDLADITSSLGNEKVVNWLKARKTKEGHSFIAEPILNSENRPAAYIINYNGQTIVAFTPTLNEEDLKVSLRNDFVEYPIGGQIHKGYYEYLTKPDSQNKSIYGKIADSLKKPEFANSNIIYTGYSMGGALATVSAILHATDNRTLPDISAVYTFGQPKVGDHDFAAEYNNLGINHHRVLKNDPVTSFPPNDSYTHVGKPHYINVTTTTVVSGKLRTIQSTTTITDDRSSIDEIEKELLKFGKKVLPHSDGFLQRMKDFSAGIKTEPFTSDEELGLFQDLRTRLQGHYGYSSDLSKIKPDSHSQSPSIIETHQSPLNLPSTGAAKQR